MTPQRGMWTCRHGVDGRDYCDECHEVNAPQGVKVGDRIRLTNMPDDPCPIEAGAEGTVERVTEVHIQPYWWSITVDWDNGRGLTLSVPPDKFEVI